MRLMGVDPGKARTGLAVSDEGGTFAFPKEVIREPNAERLVKAVAARAREWGVTRLVIGLPKNMDGSLGPRAEECTALAEALRCESGLETVLWDERCTTMAAYTALDEAGRYGKKRKEAVDAVAAVMILQSYLDWLARHNDDVPQPL